MTFYCYKAIEKNGKILNGTLESPSSVELKKHIHNLGLGLITYSEANAAFFSKKIKLRLLMDFCLHLEQFENAGISLKNSLENIYHLQTAPKLKFVVQEIIKDIEGGVLFSKALIKHSSVFDPVFIGLIAAGEKTGRFSFVLQHIFQHLKWLDDIKAQTFKALYYPLIMSLVLFGVLVILMLTVLPVFTKFMGTFVESLSLSTLILISFSNFLLKNIIFLCSSIAGLVFLLITFCKLHSRGFYWKEYFLNTLPLIGPLRQRIVLTRFCHIFAIMFESGIDIIPIIQTARQCLRYGPICHALERAEQCIKEGLSLAHAFEKVDFFPSFVIQMLKIGEQTGSLQKTLFYIKDYFDTALKRQVDHIVSLLEPLMIICLGCIVAFIVYSIFLPVYDILSIIDY